MQMRVFFLRYAKIIFASTLLTTPIFPSNPDQNNLASSSPLLATSTSLSEQSQQFWQAQQPPVDDPDLRRRLPRPMRSGYALTSFQQEEIERASYRHAFSQMLRQDLPVRLQEKRQAHWWIL